MHAVILWMFIQHDCILYIRNTTVYFSIMGILHNYYNGSVIEDTSTTAWCCYLKGAEVPIKRGRCGPEPVPLPSVLCTGKWLRYCENASQHSLGKFQRSRLCLPQEAQGCGSGREAVNRDTGRGYGSLKFIASQSHHSHTNTHPYDIGTYMHL